MTEEFLKVVTVTDELKLEFRDNSNRYFGDYYRVLIEVDALITRDGESFHMRYQRPLKRMGVSSSDIERQKILLVKEFIEATNSYMCQPDYVKRLIEISKKAGKQIWKQI